MNIYFATRHTIRPARSFFGTHKGINIRLLEVAFVNEKGEVTRIFPERTAFAEAEMNGVLSHLAGGGKLYGYDCAESFVAMKSLSVYPMLHVPEYPIELHQTVLDYVRQLHDSYFGLGTEFRYIATPDIDGVFSDEQKAEMFMTHRNAPDMKSFDSAEDEALWAWKFHSFFKSFRAGEFEELEP